ncbi:hypothetical protein [Marinobacter sp. X15-166B]|uniref:hypothetical protein n=1 Tax=Marinobacter sp. X15-166B TaxID=1897620 RepID=UPI00085BB031|nr:hypothetical protein [Marinobacter sp. X15-166B]OEY67008.1 hypothetical protein BG841_11440 [Marinobacter sp. X15-166B]
MLKELWRKTLGQPVAVGSEAPAERPIRLAPHLTHTGELHLERLTMLLSKRYGQSFDDSQDEGVRHLLRYAARIQDREIQTEFLLFFLNCSPVIQDYLRAEGIIDTGHFLTKNKAMRCG